MNPDLAKRYSEQISGIQSGNTGKTGGSSRAVGGPPAAPAKVIQPGGSGFINYAGRVATQAVKLGAAGAVAAGRFVANTAVDIAKTGASVVDTFADSKTQPFMIKKANQFNEQLDRSQEELEQSYRTGKVSREDYAEKLRELSEARSQMSKKLIDPILAGPSPGERAGDLVETAVNVLAVGRLSSLKSVVKTEAKNVLEKSVTNAAGTIQNTLLRVPAAKELIIRNANAVAKREAQRLAGETVEQYVGREGKRIAMGLLIKRPLFYQQNIEDATNIYTGMAMGDYGQALSSTGWIASQMIGGGPIGWFLRQGQKAGIKLRTLARGRESFIDKLSAQIGNGNTSQITRYLNTLKEKAPEEYKKTEEMFRIMQETNLRVADERVDDAVANVLQTYDQAGIPRENIHPKTFIDDYARWHEAAEIVDSLKGRKIQGLDDHQVANLVVIRWDSVMKRGLADAIQKAGNDKAAMAKVLDDFSQRTANGWGNNPNLMKQLARIIDESFDAEEAARRIKAIPTATAMPDGLPKTVQKRLAKLGYGVAVPMGGVRKTPVVRLEDTRKLITGAISGATDVFDEAVEPQPAMRAIAGALDKLGLSPQSANRVANSSLRQSLVASLTETDIGRTLGLLGRDGDIAKGGQAVLSQLQRYVENKKPAFILGKISSGKSAVTDVRMLAPREIAEALGVSISDAKQVQRAITDAYTKVPLELRGLGDRVVDYAFKYNPAHKYYARIQSALRYTYNPFFRFQEQVETAALSRMNANKFLWMQPKEKLNRGVEKLTNAGFFEGNQTSAAADDMVFGRISANMTKFQKRNLAGLAQTIADRKGITLDDMIANYPDELDDALRVVVQYPNKGILASSIARTLNVAFFPMRYNAKVTMLVAKKIAELPPSLQLGVIQSFLKAKEWLQSDEGIRWQSEHADAIKVFKWATPVGSIQSFYKIATGNVEAPGDLGLLGGLPFGMISQILDSQGIINLNTPYINPSTGDQFPDYIPQTTRARAAVAVQDFLGSMFSFPGRTLGMVGKEATLRDAVDIFIDTNGADFEKRLDPNLTPLQKKWVEVLKGDTSEEALNALYTSPASGQFNYYTLPPFDLPISAPTTPIKPVEKRTRLPSERTGPRQKKLPQQIR